MLHIPEMFSNCQGRERYPESGPRGLVHLAVNQGCLFHHAGLGHLVPQVVALAAALTHSGKHRVSAVLIGHIAYKLHYQHGLAHSRAAEKPYLSALGIGGQQIHHLYACLQHIFRRYDIRKIGGVLVYGLELLGIHRSFSVYGLAYHIEHTAQGLLSHGHFDRSAGGSYLAASGEAVGRAQGYAAHCAAPQLLNHLGGNGALAALQINCIIYSRHLSLWETHVHYRPHNFAYCSFFHFILHSAERWPHPQSRRSPW